MVTIAIVLHPIIQTVQRCGQKIGMAGNASFNFILLHYIHLVFIMLIHQGNGFRFKAWGKPDPHRPAEDLAFAVARFFQANGALQNYYMVCLPKICAF